MRQANKASKLNINKETLRTLTADELGAVNGGEEAAFTYSLSLGERCKKSNAMTGGGYTCKCNAIE